jgi:hypothetical protein
MTQLHCQSSSSRAAETICHRQWVPRSSNNTLYWQRQHNSTIRKVLRVTRVHGLQLSHAFDGKELLIVLGSPHSSDKQRRPAKSRPPPEHLHCRARLQQLCKNDVPQYLMGNGQRRLSSTYGTIYSRPRPEACGYSRIASYPTHRSPSMGVNPLQRMIFQLHPTWLKLYCMRICSSRSLLPSLWI